MFKDVVRLKGLGEEELALMTRIMDKIRGVTRMAPHFRIVRQRRVGDPGADKGRQRKKG